MARIFALADVWDALHYDQPYRSAWPEDAICTYISQQAACHFDPKLAQEFLNMVRPAV